MLLSHVLRSRNHLDPNRSDIARRMPSSMQGGNPFDLFYFRFFIRQTGLVHR